MNNKKVLFAAILAVSLAAIISFATLEGILNIPQNVLMVMRWLAI